MFFYAQKAVLYPEDPLYSQDTKEVYHHTQFTMIRHTLLDNNCGLGSIHPGEYMHVTSDTYCNWVITASLDKYLR